jgi:branched-chain amino acid aminotransferase
MIKPSQQFFLQDSKIHTTSSSACVLPPPSDHIYEVFRVIDGVPLFLEDHLQRLQFSIESVGMEYSIDYFLEITNKLLKLNGRAEGNIKIIVWKQGNYMHDMIFYDKHSYPSADMIANGIQIGILERERTNPNVKLFDNNMRKDAMKLIDENGFYEVLLCSEEGLITEGSRSNVFFIKDNQIITPPASQVLEGVTRKKVISLIKKNGFQFSETEVHKSQLHEFESVFITGTSRRVLPVHTIFPLNTYYNCSHNVIRTLQDLFLKLTIDYVLSKKQDK